MSLKWFLATSWETTAVWMLLKIKVWTGERWDGALADWPNVFLYKWPFKVLNPLAKKKSRLHTCLLNQDFSGVIEFSLIGEWLPSLSALVGWFYGWRTWALDRSEARATSHSSCGQVQDVFALSTKHHTLWFPLALQCISRATGRLAVYRFPSIRKVKTISSHTQVCTYTLLFSQRNSN
jgi:hypothetical protein